MSKMLHFTIVVIFSALLCQSLALPAQVDDRYLDKEYNGELTNWLIALQYPQHVHNLCKYYDSNLFTGPMPKRNSELINSLLSLPKNMNDAGK